MRGRDYRGAAGVFAQLYARAPSEEHGGWYAGSLAALDDIERAASVVEHDGGPGRGFAVGQCELITALIRAGRYDEAMDRYERHAADPAIGTSFRSTRSDGAVAAAYRATLAPAPRGDELLVFYHLPFVGGTSLQDAFVAAFLPERRVNIRRKFGAHDIAQWTRLPLEQVEAARFMHLHYPFPIDMRGTPHQYFTVVREPASQVLSGYFKRMRHAHIFPTRDIKHRPTPAQHVDYLLRTGVVNLQVRQLAVLHPEFATWVRRRHRSRWSVPTRETGAEENLAYLAVTRRLSDDDLLTLAKSVAETQMTVCGVLEHLDAACIAAFACIGVPIAPTMPHLGRSRRAREHVDDRMVRRLRDANALDARFHAWARTHFERRFGGLAAAFAEDNGVAATAAEARRGPAAGATPC